MSKFIPDPGTLFYAVCTRLIHKESGFGITATIISTPDRSWHDAIFRAVATDGRMLVGDIVYGCGYIGNKRVTLALVDFNFMPVGPDVVAALGLTEGAST